MAHDITFGVDVWHFGCELDELRAAWRLADEGGFDDLWVCDRFLPVVPREAYQTPIYGAWSLLAAMAEATRRIRIGVVVSGNTYRHPGVLAKIGVTSTTCPAAAWSSGSARRAAPPAPTSTSSSVSSSRPPPSASAGWGRAAR